jgi:deoxycytidylate deaminase
MCTHQPCPACAKSIIQAGITTVFVGKGTWVSQKESDVVATKNMFEEANVTTEFTCW